MTKLPDPVWTEEQHHKFAKEIQTQLEFWIETWRVSMRWMRKGSQTYRSVCRTARRVQDTKSDFHRLYIKSFRSRSPYEGHTHYFFN